MRPGAIPVRGMSSMSDAADAIEEDEEGAYVELVKSGVRARAVHGSAHES